MGSCPDPGGNQAQNESPDPPPKSRFPPILTVCLLVFVVGFILEESFQRGEKTMKATEKAVGVTEPQCVFSPVVICMQAQSLRTFAINDGISIN